MGHMSVHIQPALGPTTVADDNGLACIVETLTSQRKPAVYTVIYGLFKLGNEVWLTGSEGSRPAFTAG